MVVLGEQHAAVDQQDLSVDLEGGHVPPDVPQASQRDDPERSGGERRRGLQSTGRHGVQATQSLPARAGLAVR
jgi:hypothetical protein